MNNSKFAESLIKSIFKVYKKKSNLVKLKEYKILVNLSDKEIDAIASYSLEFINLLKTAINETKLFSMPFILAILINKEIREKELKMCNQIDKLKVSKERKDLLRDIALSFVFMIVVGMSNFMIGKLENDMFTDILEKIPVSEIN